MLKNSQMSQSSKQTFKQRSRWKTDTEVSVVMTGGKMFHTQVAELQMDANRRW